MDLSCLTYISITLINVTSKLTLSLKAIAVMTNTESETFTTGEVAKLCDVNFRTVIRWAERGLLPAYRLPGRGDYRIKTGDLRAFLIEHSMPLPARLNPQKVALIVDDEPAMGAAIARALHRAGFETQVATGGFQAGLLLQTLKPQLMTLDLHMPGIDGFAVLELLRSTPLDPAPKVLIVSGDAARSAEALARGADGVVTKPFTQEELLTAIDTIFSR